jgi:hypothetical protein
LPEAKTFVLDVKIDPDARAATLRLTDEAEQVLGSNDVRLESQPASMWEALFDTPAHLLRLERAARPEGAGSEHDVGAAAEAIEQLGVFLGRQVMGTAIIEALAAGDDRRALLVRITGPEGAAHIDPLTSAFARVPWQIARPALGVRPLVQRNVVVRVAPPLGLARPQGPAALTREPGEPLRVLCVFVEAPGGRPLAARFERERLRELFYDEIMPDNQVMLDILCHGVTRERLRQRLQDAGGYHIIHWSGHGYDTAARGAQSGPSDLSDPSHPSDQTEHLSHLSGSELAELLAEAGGFIPQLVFLSASNTAPLGSIDDWPALKTALVEPRERTSEASEVSERPTIEGALRSPRGCGETAMELLHAGVPQVVVMRHPAGYVYARRLARRFYRSLLAAGVPQPADSALALAQRELLTDKRATEHHPADHASAIVLGERPLRFELERGQSPDLALRRPQPQPILRGRPDLEPPRAFAGRSSELAHLAALWLPKKGAAVALVHGSAGLGKTSFAAEAIHLWHRQFHWVMAFQARHPGLLLDDFYRDLDKRLTRASPAYRERCKENEERRVFLPARQDLTGPERYELLRDNLIDVLSSASILLVLDGFEENLGSVPVEEGHLANDPEWDALLRALVERLADVTGSRVLITSRSPIASLARSSEVVSLHLGPLLANEALSMVEGAEPLRGLLRGGVADRELALRVLETSAGHPNALHRLGDLAREGRALLESGVGLRQPPPPVQVRASSEAGAGGREAAAASTVPAPPERPPPSIRPGPVSKRPVISYPAAPMGEEAAPPPVSIPALPPLPRDDFAAAVPSIPAPPPMATGPLPPDKIAQRAVSLLVERLTPAERNLLWRITRAPAPMQLDLIKRIAELTQ